jgi:hypothetical protein
MIFLKYKMSCHALSIGLGLEPLCIFLKKKINKLWYIEKNNYNYNIIL